MIKKSITNNTLPKSSHQIILLGKVTELTLGYLGKLSEKITSPNTWHWGEIKK